MNNFMDNIYERTITSLEAEQGYIFVLKNKRSFFPEEGSTFSITYGPKKKKAKIESYHCECQGPDKPHEHYFVRWSGLAKGRDPGVTHGTGTPRDGL